MRGGPRRRDQPRGAYDQEADVRKAAELGDFRPWPPVPVAVNVAVNVPRARPFLLRRLPPFLSTNPPEDWPVCFITSCPYWSCPPLQTAPTEVQCPRSTSSFAPAGRSFAPRPTARPCRGPRRSGAS